jgi:hypothetical protein
MYTVPMYGCMGVHHGLNGWSYGGSSEDLGIETV